MNIDVPDVEMDEVYEEGEREEFPPNEFEAEEDRPAPVNTSDEEGEPDAKKVKTKSAAKKVVKNPQIKLDDMRLCGQRGIPLVPKTFKDVKFKGKGHEVQDLDLYLSKMEHWAHRMFPKMVFDEVIERCDRLYKTKKLVKTTLIRMRNGDNLLDDDDVAREGDGDGFDDNDGDMDDAVARDATILSTTRPIRDEGEEASQRSQNQSQARPNVTASTPTEPVQITDEIRERIERNKRIAIEKRLARMQAMQEKSQSESIETPSPNADEAPRSGHSMPTVVSKSTQPPELVSRKDNPDAKINDSESAETSTADPVVTAEAESESLHVRNESDSQQGEVSAAEPEVIDESGQKYDTDGHCGGIEVPEKDLDEDELLKLINE